MSPTSYLGLFLIVSLLFLSFGCGTVNPSSPVRTISILEKSRIRAKKVPVEIFDDPEEKTALKRVSKFRLKHDRKSVPDSVQSVPETVLPPVYCETGEASFYADEFQSRKTASGESFNQKAKTAAHRELPFGTKVKVTNTQNNKSVIVTINDRGPYSEGRVIDLSKYAFNHIGSTKDGTLRVEIQVVDKNNLVQYDYDLDQS